MTGTRQDSPPSNAQTRAYRLRHDCGCTAGAVGLLLAGTGYFMAVGLRSDLTMGLRTVVIGVAVSAGTAIGAKLGWIALSRTRLMLLQSHWRAERRGIEPPTETTSAAAAVPQPTRASRLTSRSRLRARHTELGLRGRGGRELEE